MKELNAVNILKSAILLEKQGEIFYAKASEQAKDPEVKEFFKCMAEDEKMHGEALKKQFESYNKSGKFSAEVSARYTTNNVENVLNKNLKDKIESSGYEAAAIAAAINMEKNAVKLYFERSEISEDPEEVKLYTWLANWERKHLDELLALDEELKEKIWNDNGFWPS